MDFCEIQCEMAPSLRPIASHLNLLWVVEVVWDECLEGKQTGHL